MPALPSVPKVLKIALVWTDGTNTDIVTRFYVRYSGAAPTDADLNNFADSVFGFAGTHLQPYALAIMALIRVEAIDLSAAAAAVGEASGDTAGGNVGTYITSDVAVVNSYVIGRRYRGGHPRGYLPLGSSNDLDTPQNWSTTFVNNVSDAWTAFFTALEGAGWGGAGTLDHVSVSYYQGFTVVIDPVTGRARNVPTLRGAPVIDAVSTHIVRHHIGTQRRRLQY